MASFIRNNATRDGRNWWKGCGALAALVVILFFFVWLVAANADAFKSGIEAVLPGDQFGTTTSNGGVKNSNTGATGATGGLVGVQRQTQLVELTPTPTPEMVLRGPGGFVLTGIPTEVVTRKRHSTGCTLPGGCNVLSEPGVLGADRYEDAISNRSAIWTGGANHAIVDSIDMMDAVLVPEAGYVTAFSRTFAVAGGGMSVDMPDCSELEGVESCSMGVVIRGLWDDVGDRNVPVIFSDYGAMGALSYTRYPVPVTAGEFFSQDYIEDQADNSLVFDNCGATGCDVVYIVVIDLNDMSVTILRYLGNGNWSLYWTNIVGYGSL